MSAAIVFTVLGLSALGKAWALTFEPAHSAQIQKDFNGGESLLWGMVLLEACLAALLCMSKSRKPALLASTLLGCVFSIYLVVMDLSGLDVTSCGCFGVAGIGFEGHLAIVVALVFSAMMGLRYEAMVEKNSD